MSYCTFSKLLKLSRRACDIFWEVAKYNQKTLFLFSDIPVTTQVLPLTPGTSQKMSQALLDSFKSFEKVQYDAMSQRDTVDNGMRVMTLQCK
jgi:hypothetical protein